MWVLFAASVFMIASASAVLCWKALTSSDFSSRVIRGMARSNAWGWRAMGFNVSEDDVRKLLSPGSDRAGRIALTIGLAGVAALALALAVQILTE